MSTTEKRAGQEAFHQQLDGLRPRLLAFARLQLGDESQAEDLVQEALIGAWEGVERFDGRARLETWVFSILKHKLVDEIRHRRREQSTGFDPDDMPDVEGLFNPRAHWLPAARPKKWQEPEQACLQDGFWQVFDFCVLHLPESTARVFSMRELMGLETAEICAALGISEQNCWVILHRARLKLRACLENGWFDKGEDNAVL
ncbi:sigma-70 family RNA polymerase sigma factor [Marinobacterium weihaiense]|uniref:Sigma-70 family RNA polymerase sigma factor n=1 Tax=Marinobacterium weihaiense TaxID=2851016 RepID=A0ABS6MA16_9GAMM|nr:sigma-70 family RNA polymerase sigma factor [Marinobacterium weihaiense]MBV0932749.1 sigma-70 family RNA polymerase sigma factor [Marinobacterium weihaiense]